MAWTMDRPIHPHQANLIHPTRLSMLSRTRVLPFQAVLLRLCVSRCSSGEDAVGSEADGCVHWSGPLLWFIFEF